MNNDINDIELICYVYEIENGRQKNSLYIPPFSFVQRLTRYPL